MAFLPADWRAGGRVGGHGGLTGRRGDRSQAGAGGTRGAGGAKGAGADLAAKEKAIWAFAQAPLKQVGMMAFMMWMSGSGVHIFSIMMTFTGLMQPLSAIAGSGKAFERFQDEQKRMRLTAPRALYCLIQFGGFAYAMWKLANMGLLPTGVCDWVSGLPPAPVLEFSSGGEA